MQRKNFIVGVTPRLLTESGTLKQFVNDNYVEALLKRNANVIMLTLDNPNLEEVLDLCDGFLITGGSDIDPANYGEENYEDRSKEIEPRLDTIDKQVTLYAKKHKAPLIGICRGIQSINAFMGGTLHQHITNHSSIKNNHDVTTVENDILPFDKTIKTNSYHHQAVKTPGEGLEVIAKHKDGTIEAMVSHKYPFICIQWHPERLQETKESKLIFDKFFDFMKDYRK